MNLALKKNHLTASLRSIALCCVFLGAGMVSTVAVAQDRYGQGRGQEGRDDGRRDARTDPRQQYGQDARQDPRQDPRFYQREEQRHVNQEQLSDRGARMTADERRDLRRQINEVGQDIYSRPPRR